MRQKEWGGAVTNAPGVGIRTRANIMSRRTARTALVLAFGLTTAARAERPATEPAGDAAIIVTAQKRPENVQSVPISITALDGVGLVRANIRSVKDLGRVAPNVQILRGTQSAFLRVNIRGVGSASNTTIEPSVAVFIDGVYVPRAGAAVGAMLDMESVEILRGPQGTLFGRNTSVGALSLHSAAPKQDSSGRITAEIGNGDRTKLDGYLNLPLNDSMAVRIAGLAQWFGGYWTNRLDGKQYGGADDVALRGSYKAAFGNVEWLMRADYSRIKGDGLSNIDFDASSVSPAQLAAFQARLGGQLPDTDLDDRRLNQSVIAALRDQQWGLSSTLSLSLDAGTVRLIDSYRDWQNRQLDGDISFTPVPVVSRAGSYRSKSHNHELQFISPQGEWLNGALDVVAGLYYFGEDYALSEKFQMRAQFCNLLIAAGPPRNGCNAFLAAGGGRDATSQIVTQNVNSYAVYGQLTVHMTEQLGLTLGGRHTMDRKSGTYNQSVTNPFVTAFRQPEVLTFPKINDDRFTYRISLNYRPDHDLLFFANLSTGYKSAGYSSGGGSPALSTFDASGNLLATSRVYARETSTNYELGAKTSWLGGSVIANATLYRMDIRGYQDRAFNGTSFTILNAGKLRQQGVETDLAVIPVRRLKLIAAVALLDSEFLNYPNAPGLPGIGGAQNLKGKRNVFSPKWSGRIAAELSGTIGASGLSWTANGDWSFASKQFQGLTSDANPQTIQKGVALLGARVTLYGRDNRWSFALFGNNLTNRRYSVGNFYQIFDSAFGLRNGIFPGSSAVRLNSAEPRTYGAAATVSF